MPTTKVKLLQPLRGNDNRDAARRKLDQATHVTLRWLAQLWPKAFPEDTRDVQPLAIGVHDQVLKLARIEPNAPEAKVVQSALAAWTRQFQYLKASARGKDRLNLDGTAAGPIQPEHRKFAQAALEAHRRREQAARSPKPRRRPLEPRSPPTPVQNKGVRQ